MSIYSYNTSLWKVLWLLIFLVMTSLEAKNMLFALQVTRDRSLIITHNSVCHHMTLLLLLMSREMIKDVLKPSKRWAWLIRCCPTSLFICINSYTEFSSSSWQEGNLENDEQFSGLVLLLMKCQKGLTVFLTASRNECKHILLSSVFMSGAEDQKHDSYQWWWWR